MVEQLTFNQWVTGSSPVRVIYAGVAELADAPDLGSGALRRGGSSPFTRIKEIAGLAQLVEHLICNQRVACSSHVAGIKRERSSVVEHHLAKVGVAGSNPVVRLRSRGGGTGRRTGLKILRKETFVPVRSRSSA